MKLSRKSLLHSTLILSSANFLVRILGFVYRIVLSRTIGAQGMGLFQLIFPIYILALTLTSSGIPIAVSKLIAQYKATGNTRSIFKTVSWSAGIVIVMAILLNTIIILNIDFITNNILKDDRTRMALLILSPCILISGLNAILKGYFHGLKNVYPPALSDIIEQVLRITLVMTIILNISNLNEVRSTVIAALGMVSGELISLLFLHYTYSRRRYKYKKVNLTIKSNELNNIQIIKNILTIALPITFTRFIASIITSANSILIPQRLIISGMAHGQAISSFGIITGMVMPLLFLPFTIISALCVVIIPDLSENAALKNWPRIHDRISKSINITCLTAFLAMSVLIPHGNLIGLTLYKNPNVGKFLIPLSFSIIFLCLKQNLASILNGLGKQKKSASNFIFGDIIQIVFTFFLSANPRFGAYGFVIGFIASSVVVTLLNFSAVVKVSGLYVNSFKWFIEPGLAFIFVSLISKLLFNLLIKQWGYSILSLIVCILINPIAIIIILIFSGNIKFKSLSKLIMRLY